MNITVVVFAGPYVSSFRFHHIGYHIVNQAMLVPNLLILELFLIFLIVKLLEDILKPTIILFQYGVFRREIKRIVAFESIFKATFSKLRNTFICVVHRETDSTFPFEMIDFGFLFFPALSLEDDLKSPRLIYCEI